MKMKAEVLDYEARNGTYEGRAYVSKSIALLDRSEGLCCKTGIDFVLTDEQASKLPSHDPLKLRGKIANVEVREILTGQNGRMRFKGEIVFVP